MSHSCHYAIPPYNSLINWLVVCAFWLVFPHLPQQRAQVSTFQLISAVVYKHHLGQLLPFHSNPGPLLWPLWDLYIFSMFWAVAKSSANPADACPNMPARCLHSHPLNTNSRCTPSIEHKMMMMIGENHNIFKWWSLCPGHSMDNVWHGWWAGSSLLASDSKFHHGVSIYHKYLSHWVP